MKDRAADPSQFGAKLALLLGFGGVLVLMTIAGVDSIRVLHHIEAGQADLARTYLAQHDALENLRSALYRSGGAIRDYLLAGDPTADTYADELRGLQGQMKKALDAYTRVVPPEERDLYSSLAQEVTLYWETLAPILDWSPSERKEKGFRVLAEQIGPHRKKLADVADRLDAANQRAIDANNERSARLFDSFRKRTIGVVMAALSLGLLLAFLSVFHILRLEREARLRYEEILRARRELEELSTQLVSTQEQERRTISRELHDEVGQSLSALQVDLGNLAAIIPETSGEARDLLTTARKLAAETVQSVRNMALLLRPSMLDDLGLVPALEWQAREATRRTGVNVKMQAEGVMDELPDEHRTCVYRVVQEALHNASRHAQARTVRVLASQAPDRLQLTVEDDGRGFDAVKTRGMGLVGMEERVKRLGGTFRVDSQPGKGTRIFIEIPLAAHPAQAENVCA